MREKKEAVRVAGVPEANEKAAMLILVVWYRRRRGRRGRRLLLAAREAGSFHSSGR